jgi:putative DNA primase/helicase
MPRYDLDTIKSAAVGRWPEIIASTGHVNPNVLDGSHHGCPKHCSPDAGGHDRFRALDDFAQTGALFCNQCFSSKNGDGIAALQWLLNEDFGKILERLAKHLGVKAEPGRKKIEPADFLDFYPWSHTAASLWALKKPGVTVDALKRLGARYARYHKVYTVFAVPVWGPQLDANPPCGWILYRSDGKLLPKTVKKNEEVKEWVKVKLTPGSMPGLVCDLNEWKKLGTDQAPHTWWKLEGSTDTAAAMSQEWPEGHAFFTTANGAKEKPADWILKELEGQRVFVCHDADKPGQDGATWVQDGSQRRPGWCARLAKLCSDVRNVQLPFAVEPNHGPDIRDFFTGGGTVKTLIKLSDEAEKWQSGVDQESENSKRISDLPYNHSERIAHENLYGYKSDHGRDLIFWRNEWYRYKGTHYERFDVSHLEVRVRGFISNYFYNGWKDGNDKCASPRECTQKIVSEVIKNMATMKFLSPSIEMDSWINEELPRQCVAFKNGILNLEELFDEGDPAANENRTFLPHSPKWFSLTCLPYDCDLTQQCPNWLKFLDDVFNGDAQSIEAVKRWFGYLLLPDTKLQKMMFIIGPTRSGKGTMMKVMIGLFGREAVASPSLNGLASDDYALHSLYGKTIAIIPDARLSRRADREGVAEKLLQLTANDPQDVRRKYLNTLNGVELNLRFTLFSNKLPELDDSSAAMASRGIYLLMRKSYLGNEDTSLLPRLIKELPGILNWAIRGRYDLYKSAKEPGRIGEIVQPESSAHLARNMRMSMSPIGEFLNECTREHLDALGVACDDLFQRWCEWASDNAQIHRMNSMEFERKLMDVKSSLRIERIKIGGSAQRRITGIELVE